jgi:hypothetical protein
MFADYITTHLKGRQSTLPVGDWLEKYFQCVKHLPNYLAPCYFAKVIGPLYELCCSAVYRQMSP